MIPTLKFLMSEEEKSRVRTLARTPWKAWRFLAHTWGTARDETPHWYNFPGLVIETCEKFCFGSVGHEFEDYDEIFRISLKVIKGVEFHVEDVEFCEIPAPSFQSPLFERMPDPVNFLEKNKDCFIINFKTEETFKVGKASSDFSLRSDVGVLFRNSKNQLLLMTGEMPLGIRGTTDEFAIDEVISKAFSIELL